MKAEAENYKVAEEESSRPQVLGIEKVVHRQFMLVLFCVCFLCVFVVVGGGRGVVWVGRGVFERFLASIGTGQNDEHIFVTIMYVPFAKQKNR